MSKLSNKTLEFVRSVTSQHSIRPLGVLKFVDETGSGSYSVSIDATNIALTNGTTSYTFPYVGKTSYSLASSLNNTQFPVTVTAIADVSNILSEELVSSGTTIPDTFSILDRTKDNNGCIVRIKRWAASYKAGTSIFMRKPYLNGPTAPWWGRVESGEFWQKYQGILYKFSVPEYSTQSWSAKYGKPFKDISGEVANFIGEQKIQLSRRPILWRNNIVLASRTSEVSYSSNVIRDVDSINGIIYLKPGTVLPKDTLVFYSYLEKSYEYKSFNLNGHFSQNPYALDKFVVIYARPTESSSGVHRNRGIYHQVGASLEDALYSIKEAKAGEPVVVLGAFNVRANYDVEDITITDTRRYGGGIVGGSYGDKIEDKFPQTQYFFDIGRKEGIPYPGAASIVIELPAEIKEVLSVSELKRRAKKFIAAGVYPIFKHKEEDYYNQFIPLSGYNLDISLFNTSIEAAYTGSNTGELGGVNEPAYWWDTSTVLPNPFEQATGEWSSSDISYGATVNTGEYVPYLELSNGSQYKQKYIKGPAESVFSWEERAINGQWTRKTLRDSRTVGSKQLVGGELSIDATLGYVEVRNLYSFSPVPLAGTGIWSDVASSVGHILKRVKDTTIVASGLPTGLFLDIRNASGDKASAVNPGRVSEILSPIVYKYDTMTGVNFWEPVDILSGVASYAYNSTSQDSLTGGELPSSWDVSSESYTGKSTEAYNAIEDLHMFSRTATQLMNEHTLRSSANSPSRYYGEASAYATGSSVGSEEAYSGAMQVFRATITGNLTGMSGVENSDIISPFFVPSTMAQVPLDFGSSSGDIYYNQYKEHAQVPRAIAALYATMIMPTTGQEILGVSHTEIQEQDLKSLALSGIGHRLLVFSGHSVPYHGTTGLSVTWLNQYNRIGDYAGNTLGYLSDAMDYLYYGNYEWAGIANTGDKTAPYYNATYNAGTDYRYDTDFFTGSIARVSDGTTTTPYLYFDELVEEYKSSLEMLEPVVTTLAKRGGLIGPGHVKLLRSMAWLVNHKLAGEIPFTGDYDLITNSLITAAESYVKSAISQDGKISQHGVFGWEPAPFSGEMPSEILSLCADMSKMYALTGDVDGKEKWMSISAGMYHTATGQYKLAGGYPIDPSYSLNSTIAGEPGVVPMKGFLSILGRKDSVFTDAEVQAITGSI